MPEPGRGCSPRLVSHGNAQQGERPGLWRAQAGLVRVAGAGGRILHRSPRYLRAGSSPSNETRYRGCGSVTSCSSVERWKGGSAAGARHGALASTADDMTSPAARPVPKRSHGLQRYPWFPVGRCLYSTWLGRLQAACTAVCWHALRAGAMARQGAVSEW